MSTIRFPSAGQPQMWVYQYETGAWNRESICPDASMYQTYGDGMVQHSGSCGVGFNMLADFCLSLAAFACGNPEDPTVLRLAGIETHGLPDSQAVKWAMGLAEVARKAQEAGKGFYVNVKGREHTTRDKSNDRRWQRFTCEEWTLPTKRVSDLLCSEHCSVLNKALFLAHVCNLTWQFGGVSGKPWERFTGESYASMAGSLEKAADILLRTLQAIDDIKRARVALDNAAKRLEHKEEKIC